MNNLSSRSVVAIGALILSCAIGLPRGANSQAPPDELVAYWPMDEESGSIAYDQSGNGLDGTISGATIIDGVVGKARSFDGNDYIEVPDNDLLDINDEITIVLWAKVDPVQSECFLISKRVPDGEINYLMKFGQTATGDDAILFQYYSYPGVGYRTLFDLNDGEWHHLAISLVYGDPSSAKWVIEGSPSPGSWLYGDGTPGGGTEIPNPNSYNLQMGRQLSTSPQPIKGALDQVRIYNRALTEEEIRATFDQEAPVLPEYYVSGNEIRDRNDNDKVLIIKGLDYGSLAWIEHGDWGNGYSDFESYSDFMLSTMVNEWNANAIRIAISQVFWLTKSAYKARVKSFVNDAIHKGMHVILDLHTLGGGTLTLPPNQDEHGNTWANGGYMFPMPDQYSMDFWQEVAGSFKDDSRVFFEVFNEPHHLSGDWNKWKGGGTVQRVAEQYEPRPSDPTEYEAVGIEDLVRAIRNRGASNLVLVGGLDYAYDLSKVLEPQFRFTYQSTGQAIENIVYVTHPYEYVSKYPVNIPGVSIGWEAAFGVVTDNAPVIATEFGDLDCGTDYTKTFLRYGLSKNMGFTAWCWYWNDDWSGEYPDAPCRFPTIISGWDGIPSTMGTPIRRVMTGEATDILSWPLPHEYLIGLIISKLSPVDIVVTDPDGLSIGPGFSQIPSALYAEFEISPGDSGATVVVPTPKPGVYRVDVVAWPSATPNETFSVVVILESDTTYLADEATLSEIPPDGYAFYTLPFASLSGFVTADSTEGLLGVNVDIYDSTGALWQSVVTDDSGNYHIDSIPNGDYTVTVITPLGYQADEETKEFTIHHVPVTVDFNLTELEITPQQRSRAYWAHQLHKALQNKPKDYTLEDFSNFVSLINVHFNQNQVNPVDFYSVPQPADQADSLGILKKLLHMRNTGEWEPFLKRLAKSQLIALMLNVVSGKVSQTHEISADGRTISQAITYCDMLVNDEIDPPEDGGPGCGSPWFRYLRTSFILLKCNLGLTVPAGMIPEDVIQIAYRIHNQESLPEEFALHQNYPNPFNPTTDISFTLPKATKVKLEIFNVMGQKVATLVDGQLEAGDHTVQWDGSAAASGVYLYRLQTDDFVDTKKMILLK